MADGTKIEWTDATWNPITGCSIASAGCKRCYAMLLAGTRMQHHPSRAGLTHVVNGNHVWTGEVRFNDGSNGTPNWLDQPLAWSKARMIFVNAHGDTFHENVPWAWVDKIMARAALAPQHVFQILTKRSERMRAYMNDPETPARIHKELMAWGGSSMKDASRRAKAAWRLEEWPLANVWAGVSVEDQSNAKRLDDLVETKAAVLWVSAEPLLGSLDLTPWLDRIHWVVAGGESDKGPRARPMNPDWVRALRDQCQAAGVAFLFKQHGDWAPGEAFGMVSDGPVTGQGGSVRDWMNRYVVCEDRADRLRGHSFTEHATNLVYHVGKARAGRVLDGVTHDGLPA